MKQNETTRCPITNAQACQEALEWVERFARRDGFCLWYWNGGIYECIFCRAYMDKGNPNEDQPLTLHSDSCLWRRAVESLPRLEAIVAATAHLTNDQLAGGVVSAETAAQCESALRALIPAAEANDQQVRREWEKDLCDSIATEIAVARKVVGK